MAAVDDRNKRLDQLLAATNSWADRRTKELNDKVAAVKKLMKGRTGSERLATATSKAATDLVVSQIDDFLNV